MHFAPLPDDDKIVKKIPNGKVITVEAQKEQLDKEGHTIMATGLELPGDYGNNLSESRVIMPAKLATGL